MKEGDTKNHKVMLGKELSLSFRAISHDYTTKTNNHDVVADKVVEDIEEENLHAIND